MPYTVHCPLGHAFLAPESYVGREVRCPFCQQMTVVRNVRTADEAKEKNPPLELSSDFAGPHREASGSPLRGNRSRSSQAERPIVPASLPIRPQAISAASVVGLMFVAVSNLVPAILALFQNDRGPWPFVLAGLTLLEMSATLLLVLFPDWYSLRMTGTLFGVVAGLFGMAAAFLAFAPEAKLRSLAVSPDSQDAAARWMVSLMAIQATTAFLCFRAAETWRRRVAIIFSHKTTRVSSNGSATV